MYTIEIDDEVYGYLKSKAEPFVDPPDTPNTVLRRLFFKVVQSNKANDTDIIDTFAGGIPAALKQILQVIHIVDSKGLSRSSASHKLAIHYGFAVQTIIDKYTRQIGITASEFDRLLSESDRTNLARRLNNRFPGHDVVISKYLHNPG